jgi:hypothetical protein
MSCTWNNKEHTEILLTKTNGTLILKEKDYIRYEGRELGVRIEKFAWSKGDIGPIGFTYLPWRGDRWATIAFNLAKGDIRRLICNPTGVERGVWGEMIDWETVESITNPESNA